jgi:hypothetical protein
MRTVILSRVGLVLVAGSLAGAALATAATPAIHGGSITYSESSTSNGSGTVVIGGAFADYGSDRAGALDRGTVNVVTLKLGSFEVDIARLERALHASTDARTCVYVESVTASARLFAGTGAYAGISGTLEVTVRGTGVLPRLPGGACASFGTAEPVVAISTATGTGRVSF